MMIPRITKTQSLSRHELERGEYSPWFRKSLDPLLRTLCVVLLCVRSSHCVTNARTANWFTTHRNFELSDLNRPAGLLLECLKPSRRFVVPRARKDTIVNNHKPHARVSVLGSRAHAEDLRLSRGLDDVFRERITC